jgi:hypothetical protein
VCVLSARVMYVLCFCISCMVALRVVCVAAAASVVCCVCCICYLRDIPIHCYDY